MKRVVKILVISIVITCCLTIAKIALTPLLMKDSNFGITSLENHGTDILFVGSSIFRQGIDTKDLVIDGKDTYQLSYNGFQPFAEHRTLEDVLDHTDIECLVIDMCPFTAIEEPKISDTRLFQDRSFSFTYDLFSQIRNHGSADYYDLFEMIVQSNNETFFTWPVSYPFINERYYRGSKIGESSGATEDHLYSIDLKFSDETKFNPVQTSALDNIISLCNEQDIEVVFLELPKFKRMYEDTSYSDQMQSYLDFLKDKDVRVIISEKTAGMCQASYDVEVYEYDSSDASLHSDMLHISSDGRKAFTKTLLPFLNNS